MTKNENQICHFHSSIQISECCICTNQMLESDQLFCGHPVCRGCLRSFRDTRCPLCRREIEADFIRESDKKKMRERFESDREQDRLEEERDLQ
jgi:hypothetical protein